MSLLEIILLLVAIAAGGLYYFTKQKVKEQEKYIQKEVESLAKKQLNTLEAKSDLEESNKELQSLYDNAKEEIRELLGRIRKVEENTDLKVIKTNPVRFEDLQYELEYKGEISWSSLEINIALLIADNKLFDVFKKLLNSKLLPESIQEQIDFQLDGLMVLIWCQEFDEEGTPIRSLTWYEIIEQIINKKRIITDYLNGVIQESNRAMVVHQALSEKPVK